MANDYQPLAAGIWPCVVLSGSVGEQTDKNDQPTGRIVARVNIRFTDGPNSGRIGTYEDEINAKSSPYVMRSLKAAGWKGAFPLSTVESDIAATAGVSTTAEVKHLEVKRGARYDEWAKNGFNGPAPVWDKINALGRGPKALAKPSAGALADAEEQMRRAMTESGGSAPDDDVPHAVSNDDIPFVSCSINAGLGEIARVLR